MPQAIVKLHKHTPVPNKELIIEQDNDTLKDKNDHAAISNKSQAIIDSFEGAFKKIGVCRTWEGVLEAKKLRMSLIFFISNPQIKAVTATTLYILIFLHHEHYKPYDEKLSNCIETT